MDTATELAGVDALSAGARTSADISNLGQCRSSLMYRISWIGLSHIIISRAGTTSHGSVLSADAIRLMILPVAQKYGITKATLFGSYARGEATEGSDIDILIECDSIRNMKDYLALEEGLRSAIGKKVDLVMADALRSENTRAARRLIEHIKKDQVIVYERTQ